MLPTPSELLNSLSEERQKLHDSIVSSAKKALTEHFAGGCKLLIKNLKFLNKRLLT